MKFVFVIIFIISNISLARKLKTTQEFSGVVSHCHDGDTCTFLSEGKKIKVRLSGIDTPELKQQDGKRARDFTEGLIKGKVVRLLCDGKSFKRKTCTLFLNDQNINSQIVQAGFAFDVPKYSKGKYKEDMVKAKSEKVGIWKNNPTSPYCFRKPHVKPCKLDPSFMGK